MTKLLVGFIVLGTLLITYPVGKRLVDTIRAGSLTQTEENPNYQETKVPETKDLLADAAPLKMANVHQTVTLEEANTVVFRGVVNAESVGKAMLRISNLSRNLPKSQPIYLVLDTPGGSVFDGVDFIDFLSGLPQEVKTVTIFAASMGFQIVENNPGERLIVRSGMLMSHRAAGGLEGQFNGEFESRYRMVKREIDYLDTTVANRMGLTYDQYQAKIKDELWVHGFDALDQKVADREILLQCGETLNGTEDITVDTLFGPVTVTYSDCPLLRTPVGVSMGSVPKETEDTVNTLLYDKIKFVKQVIVTNKFYSIFSK